MGKHRLKKKKIMTNTYSSSSIIKARRLHGDVDNRAVARDERAQVAGVPLMVLQRCPQLVHDEGQPGQEAVVTGEGRWGFIAGW